MEQDVCVGQLDEQEPKQKRKRRRPHTKGYRLFLKNEIEKALCAQLPDVTRLFSIDDNGFSSANLNHLITLLGLNTERYNRLSLYALKSISNVSALFRIDGGPTRETLRIFRTTATSTEDSAVVYVDNLPKNCRVLYVVQRASMFGTVVSIRARFFGDKRSKLYYTFATDNVPSASTTVDPLLSERRVESAFIRFVDPTSADKFCKAYKHNVPGKFCSPGKQKKFFTKRKKSIQRAIAFQKNLYNKTTALAAGSGVKQMNLSGSNHEADELFEEEDDQNLENNRLEASKGERRGLKRRADTPAATGNAKKVCFGGSKIIDVNSENSLDKNPSGLPAERSTVLLDSPRNDAGDLSVVKNDKQLSPSSREVPSTPAVEETSELVSAVKEEKKKRHRKKKYGKRRKVAFRRRCKVHHVSRYFSKMQVLPLAMFIKLRDEYMSLRKANIMELKKKLKVAKVPLKVGVVSRSRFKKVRGRHKVLLRAAALRERSEPTGSANA